MCDAKTYFSDDKVPVRLDELYYKDLMKEIVPNNVAGRKTGNLPFRDWAPLVPTVDYAGFRNGIVHFEVPTPTPHEAQRRLNVWDSYIKFVEWEDQVVDLTLEPMEAARLILWGANLQVHCNCPSYSFWGFQYIMTQLDASIFPETRFPGIRNPHIKGIVCKHLIRVLKVLPFYAGDLARSIKQERARLKLHAPTPAPQQDHDHDHDDHDQETP